MFKDKITFEEYPLQNTSYKTERKRSLRGPLRLVRLCLLGIILPSCLLAVPLYMRYRVYGHHLYPLAMSDMRMLDSKISTTWCQRQLVNANTTFNAFLLSSAPTLSAEKKPLSMVRELVLEDDMKEYWGFYLLSGTSVTVSTCVRWPGASLIVIRGHKHLHQCAYIGDNSSEELDELMEAIREGTYVKNSENDNMVKNTDDGAPANEPELMKRHRSDVKFHSSKHTNDTSNHTIPDNFDSSDITDPKTMQKLLDDLRTSKNINKARFLHEPEKSHIHRNSTIAEDETKNIRIIPPKTQTTSEEVLSQILFKLKTLGKRGSGILKKVNEEYGKIESGVPETVIDTKGRHYSKPKVSYNENIDEVSRRKRDLILSTAKLMNGDDEENDKGIEEGFTPDGIADHRGIFNETTRNDMSNSEFWSSFSSSEEALLNCAGLILNLPLTPHHKCQPFLNDDDIKESYRDNTITYRVPTNGYYFFVFNSENEVQPNYIRVQFNLLKSVYNMSNPVSSCANTSETCAMDLSFFSSEILVMELPVKGNDTLMNEEYVVISECEPRTAIYAICVISVPILVMLFAFA